MFCAILLDAVSTLLTPALPDLALRLNPLNADALIAHALPRLNSADSNERAAVRNELGRMARLAPADARFVTLLGLERHGAGDVQAAGRYFETALALLPTEIQALTHTAAYALARGNYALAARKMEILARRWPQTWPRVASNLPAILAIPAARTEFSKRFSQDGNLAKLLIEQLVAQDAGLAPAFLLMLEWHGKSLDGADNLVNLVTTKLVAGNRAAEAFALFRATRPPGSDLAYVSNGEFRQPSSGNPFDWRILDQAGVEFRPAGNGHGLDIRFLDAPLRLRNVSQVLRLAPGRYRLAVDFDASALRAPRPLRMVIACFGASTVLADTALDPQKSSASVTADFEVPANGCALARIALASDQAPADWKNRFAGTLRIRRVAITRPDA